MARLAVVLFNLGGPDCPEAVRPFLDNLFNDPAILGLPRPLRGWLARVIAARREATARGIYARIGGGSPLLALTQAQAAALESRLDDARVFVAMRYWHPMSEAAAVEVGGYGPRRIVLLPLYPQFSTTTTASSLAAWRRAALEAGIEAPTRAVCCYPTLAGLVAAEAELIQAALAEAEARAPARVLFSAHGLPERVVARGDPYPWQVERTAAAVAAAVATDRRRSGLDWVVCYQSKVGPLRWTGPSTEDEIRRAGRDGRAVVVVPIAFVSEHSETLYELDIAYRQIAREAGVPAYVRVPAVGTHAAFIDGLAGLVKAAAEGESGLVSAGGGRLCPTGLGRCPCTTTRGETP